MTESKKQGEGTASPSKSDFIISRVFNAPRELVWKAWTEPKHLTQWWGPRDFTNPVCELDVRPGGAFHIVMRSPEGTVYPLPGVYQEVVPPRRLSYLMDVSGHPAEWHAAIRASLPKDSKLAIKELLTIVTFDEEGAGTRVTIRMPFAAVELRQAMLKMGMNEGWSQSLDRLVVLLAKI